MMPMSTTLFSHDTKWQNAGDYTILSQAEYEGKAIFTRHSVRICAWGAKGLWSDPCMWDQSPEEFSHVIIERGMHMTLDVVPPTLSSLTVCCC